MAKLNDKKRQSNIVFIIILFWVVLILEKIILALLLGFIGQLIDSHKFSRIKSVILTETRKACKNYTNPKSFAMAIKCTLLFALK